MKVFSAVTMAVILITLPSSIAAAGAQSDGFAMGQFVEKTIFGGALYSGYPTFSIVSVAQGTSVTIQGSNFPPNDTFWIRMNTMGTQGIGGSIVETVTTDAGGNLSDTSYNIPNELVSDNKIAIRLISPVTGYYAYNWFYNNTQAGANTGGPVSSSSYSGYPSFTIAAVQRDKNVTISASNFPPNDEFYVRLNTMGTQGINGDVVQTVTTDASGNLNDLVYFIPDGLKTSHQIAIRLESKSSIYYAYNWFYNNNAP